MQSELIVVLEEANRAIRGLVSRLSENSVEANHAVLSPGELKALSQKLAQVAKLLGLASLAQSKDEALPPAIDEYAANLETLKRVAGKAQDSLGKKRDQLKKNLEHLNSARAWVETYRATNLH